LHTTIVVLNALVDQLRPRSAHGRLQAKPKRLCFVIFVIQTVRVEVRADRAIVKNSGIL